MYRPLDDSADQHVDLDTVVGRSGVTHEDVLGLFPTLDAQLSEQEREEL